MDEPHRSKSFDWWPSVSFLLWMKTNSSPHVMLLAWGGNSTPRPPATNHLTTATPSIESKHVGIMFRTLGTSYLRPRESVKNRTAAKTRTRHYFTCIRPFSGGSITAGGAPRRGAVRQVPK